MRGGLASAIRKDVINFLPRKQFLAMLVVFSVMANAFVPRFALSQDDYYTFNQIVQQQSTLLRFFSLSTIPLKIINEIFPQEESALAGIAGKQAEKKKDNKTNTAYDFSIISVQGLQNTGKSFIEKCENMNSFLWALKESDARISIGAFSVNISPHVFVFLAFIIFFFMLPRSSVGDYYATIINMNSKYTQLGFPSWVFYLPNNILTGELL